MSIVSLININVLNNPAPFNAPYKFEITFECLEQLKHVGPVPVGINKFVFEADPPSPDLIPASELVSVTVILLSCSYNGKEFVRVGYYVNNEYDNEELRENPPNKVAVDHIVRNVLAEKPRVTRFNIVWDNEGPEEEFPPEQPEADEAADDEDQYGAEDDDDEEDYGEEENEEEEEEDEDVEMEDPDAKPAVPVEEGEEDIENSDDEDEEIEDAPPISSSMQGF